MNDGGPIPSSTVSDPSGEAGGGAAPVERVTVPAPDPGLHTDQSALVEHAVLESRIAELELRLRERVEENIVLDNEVRCLQRERVVSQEYVASLQHDAALFPGVERDLWENKHQLEILQAELEEVRSELEAFRNRLSGVLVDRMVVSAKRYPGVYRVGRYVTRRVVVTFRRT
jgi:predicted RNase H-like nuclease (RuvC/YqgF family)